MTKGVRINMGGSSPSPNREQYQDIDQLLDNEKITIFDNPNYAVNRQNMKEMREAFHLMQGQCDKHSETIKFQQNLLILIAIALVAKIVIDGIDKIVNGRRS